MKDRKQKRRDVDPEPDWNDPESVYAYLIEIGEGPDREGCP